MLRVALVHQFVLDEDSTLEDGIRDHGLLFGRHRMKTGLYVADICSKQNLENKFIFLGKSTE